MEAGMYVQHNITSLRKRELRNDSRLPSGSAASLSGIGGAHVVRGRVTSSAFKVC